MASWDKLGHGCVVEAAVPPKFGMGWLAYMENTRYLT